MAFAVEIDMFKTILFVSLFIVSLQVKASYLSTNHPSECLRIYYLDELRQKIENEIEIFGTILEKKLTILKPEFYKIEPDYVRDNVFSCRFCATSSSFIFEWLTEKFPTLRIEIRRTNYNYQTVVHDFVYIPKLNLIIDGTYLQFFESEKQSTGFPKIFVGTLDELKSLTKNNIPEWFTSHFIEADVVDFSQPTQDSASKKNIRPLTKIKNWLSGKRNL